MKYLFCFVGVLSGLIVRVFVGFGYLLACGHFYIKVLSLGDTSLKKMVRIL